MIMKNYKTVMLGSVATSALLLGAAAVTTPALAKNVEVGHKKGSFYLKTKDGKFSVITGAQIQMNYEYRDNDSERITDANSSETGFSARRVRFGVKGRAGHKKLTYRVSMNITTNSEADQDGDGGGFAIFDSYLQWKFAKSLNLRVGTWKQRFTESHSNSSGKLQMVDRARGTGNLGRMERDTGLGINGKLFKMLSYEAAVINGNTRKAPAANSNQSFVGSLKIEPFGNFGSAYEGDIKNSKKLKVMAMAAGFYKDNVTFSTRGNQNTFISLAGNADIAGWTVGAGMKWRGLGLYGEYVQQRFHDADTNINAGTNKTPGEKLIAWNVEASYFIIPKKWSIAGRYERFNTNTKVTSTSNATQANAGQNGETRFGIGTSYFFRGHAHKIQADWIQEQSLSTGSTGFAGATTTDAEDNKFRIQWQTRF
jgi:hypothetical protein